MRFEEFLWRPTCKMSDGSSRKEDKENVYVNRYTERDDDFAKTLSLSLSRLVIQPWAGGGHHQSSTSHSGHSQPRGHHAYGSGGAAERPGGGHGFDGNQRRHHGDVAAERHDSRDRRREYDDRRHHRGYDDQHRRDGYDRHHHHHNDGHRQDQYNRGNERGGPQHEYHDGRYHQYDDGRHHQEYHGQHRQGYNDAPRDRYQDRRDDYSRQRHDRGRPGDDQRHDRGRPGDDQAHHQRERDREKEPLDSHGHTGSSTAGHAAPPARDAGSTHDQHAAPRTGAAAAATDLSAPAAPVPAAAGDKPSAAGESVRDSNDQEAGVHEGRSEASSQGNAKDVAEFYNQLPQPSIQGRKLSPIIQMRSMNNWIKSVLIKKGISCLADGRRLRVLDLCCGKGGDLLKWRQSDVQHLAGVDIAATSVEQCQQRARQSRVQYSTEFHAVDCTRANIYTDALKDGSGATFDVTSCQFAVHYGFESEAQAFRLLDNACQNLRSGGVFIGTMPDANRLVYRLGQSSDRSFGNSVYRVTFDDKINMDNIPLYGAKYHFQLEGVVDVPEYLVYFPLLCRILEERHGMELVWKKPFHQFINDEKEDAGNKALMTRMKCLVAFKGKELGLEHNNDVGSISEDEWDAIGLYLAFCFRKR